MSTDTQWYYVKAFQKSDNKFLGWLGASPVGAVRFIGDEDEDPAKIDNVQIVGLFKSGDHTYLRAPAYHAHLSASIGGEATMATTPCGSGAKRAAFRSATTP